MIFDKELQDLRNVVDCRTAPDASRLGVDPPDDAGGNVTALAQYQ
jgi:hypothetical protein